MDVLRFLVTTLVDLYIFVVLLRIVLPLSRADFRNPLSRFVVQATQPVLAPLRRVLPGVGGVDWASVLLLWLLELGVLAFLLWNLTGSVSAVAPLQLGLYAAVRGFISLLELYFFLILVQVIASWVAPPGYNPILAVVTALTRPLMRPVQRLIPPIGGIDISPVFVIIAIQATKMLLVGRLIPAPLA